MNNFELIAKIKECAKMGNVFASREFLRQVDGGPITPIIRWPADGQTDIAISTPVTYNDQAIDGGPGYFCGIIAKNGNRNEQFQITINQQKNRITIK